MNVNFHLFHRFDMSLALPRDEPSAGRLWPVDMAWSYFNAFGLPLFFFFIASSKVSQAAQYYYSLYYSPCHIDLWGARPLKAKIRKA